MLSQPKPTPYISYQNFIANQHKSGLSHPKQIFCYFLLFMLHVFYQHKMQVGNCLDFILNAFYQHEMHAGVVSYMFYKRFWIDRVSLGYSIPNHKYVVWTVSPKFVARHSAVIAMRRRRLYARDNKACFDCKQRIPHTIYIIDDSDGHSLY